MSEIERKQKTTCMYNTDLKHSVYVDDREVLSKWLLLRFLLLFLGDFLLFSSLTMDDTVYMLL